MITKDDIMAKRPQTEVVEVEGLGSVTIRKMNGKDRTAFVNIDESKRATHLIITTVCNSEGEPMFKPSDAEAVEEIDGQTFEALALASLRVNGLVDEGEQLKN